MKKPLLLLTALLFCIIYLFAQNSMTGDGYGGRGWYKAHNYQVGAYTGYTVCGIDSQLYAWGGNVYGELGDGTNISTDTPVAILRMNHVKFYTTGYISGVIKSDNTAWIWCDHSYFSLPFADTPTQKLSDVKFMDAGMTNVIFVKNDGTVWTAGLNNFGEFGIGTTSFSSSTPVQMLGINNAVRAIAAGAGGSFSERPALIILLSDGTVKITAGDGRFQATNSLVPVTVNGLNNIIDIKTGTSGAYALDINGNVFSFGREGYSGGIGFPGMLGHGDNVLTGYIGPTQLIFPASAKPIVALSANCDGFFGLALDSSHNVYAWGDNREGALGNGDPLNQNSLTPQLVASNVIDIYAGETFSYILKTDNTLWASGNSGYNPSQNNYGSIWMNLPNIQRNVFTQIDPTIPPMNLCAPKVYGVVPVRLLNFNCTAAGNTATINWQSAEEINASTFIIEYSKDAVNFQSIATIFAKGANSNYKYVHQQVNGTAFYRLKMTDKDGSFKYSEIRVVKFDNKAGFTIAPNPANDMVYLFTKNNAVIKSIEILSVDGQVIKILNKYNSGQQISISNLARGTYILKAIYKNNEAEYGKVIKM